MKRITTLSKSMVGLCGMLVLFFTFQSCFREDLEKSFPVIEEQLIGEYLANDTTFSEFTKMLDTSKVLGLLNAYGLYTVFAPTNEAVHGYYASLKDDQGNHTITSMSQMSMSEIKEFCYNHIIKGDTLRTKYFRPGTLKNRSMNERYVTVSFRHDSIMINGVSTIIRSDVEVHNGLIHVLDKAFSPSRITISEVFTADPNFSIYADALVKTGIADYIRKEPASVPWDVKAGWPVQTKTDDSSNPDTKPQSLKYGFTILAVSDADLKKCTYDLPGYPDLADGIDNLTELEQLATYYYGQKYNHDADGLPRSNSKNYLHRFMAYHCLDRIVTSSRFVLDYYSSHHYRRVGSAAAAMPDYITTLLDNSILETLYDKKGTIIGTTMAAKPYAEFGVFNFDDPAQGAMLTDKYDLPTGGGASNGYYHGITKPIMYSKKLETAFSTKRLRFDVASFLPELTTNGIRGSNVDRFANSDDDLKKVQENATRCYVIDDNYVKGFYGSPNTRFKYIGISPYWEDYQGDEFYVTKQYNFTLETCPIPAGTYEVRMGYQATTERAISQLYFDSLPCGIPLDLAITSDNAAIGYIEPESDAARAAGDEFGYENDKMMHNRGYMKGLSVYGASHTSVYKAASARKSAKCMRRVLGIYTFDKTKKHFFSAIYLGTSVSTNKGDPQFMLDYLEFCPTELLEKEGID